MATLTAPKQQTRRRIGDAKLGLVVRMHQGSDALELIARPDPLLLYVVLGISGTVGLAGMVASSFAMSLIGFLLFALLLSPVICLLALQNLRVRATCVLDRSRGVIEIDEQSYTARFRQSFPLRAIEAIAVRPLPNAPIPGSAFSFGLFVVMPDVEYLAASSNNEATLSQTGWRMARFLGAPLETPLGRQIAQRRRPPIGLYLVAGALYLVPTVMTIVALILIFERVPGVEPSLLALLGAVFVSQIGAILALVYYRARRSYET